MALSIGATATARKDKQVLVDIEQAVTKLHRQFTEQQRSLDVRTENKIALLQDFHEFFRRRAEIDLEYGKNLEKLSDRFIEKSVKTRNNYALSKSDRASYVHLWNKFLQCTKFKAQLANRASDIYTKNILFRLQELADDVTRIAKSVKDTHTTLQNELLRHTTRLQNHMKYYYTKHGDLVFSEGKFRVTETEMRKLEESPMKRGQDKRIKHLEKTLEKRQGKFLESREKAVRSRNDYILSVASVSSILSKYFDYDLTEMITKYDHNFHDSFTSTLKAYVGVETQTSSTFSTFLTSLTHTMNGVDASEDSKMFIEDNPSFIPAMKFSFLPHAEDNVQTITAEKNIEEELTAEHKKSFDGIKEVQNELADLQLVMEKRYKVLEKTYKDYDTELNSFYHTDISPLGFFTSNAGGNAITSSLPLELKQSKSECEDALLVKFRESIMSESVQERLQAKYNILTKALGEITADPARHTMQKKRAIKLFGTSLKQQLTEMQCDIPDIVESCAKYVAKYGLKHQGIFRVPGASQEIADMKLAFEEGRDPLSGLNHWKDINAVAGVFRLYFREMAEPLFPVHLNQDYLRTSSITKLDEQVSESTSILNKMEPWNLKVIKYLLKFLNLISRHSDTNKMTSFNLAVVFGPTLIRVPQNEDLLANQGQMNVFMDTLISEFFRIFPDEHNSHDEFNVKGGGGPVVDDVYDDHACATEDELDSEDDHEGREAVALYSYIARTTKELSFSQGDSIMIYSRATKEWYDARVKGQFGFVPASYVRIIESSSNENSSTEDAAKTLGSSRSDSIESPSSPRETKKFPPAMAVTATVAESSSATSTTTSAAAAVSTFGRPASAMSGVRPASAVTPGQSSDKNVFAALDPTVDSPSAVRRVGSVQLPRTSQLANAPVRANSDRSKLRIPLKQQQQGLSVTTKDLQNTKLASTPRSPETSFPPALNKSSSKLGRQSPLLPEQRPNPAAGRPLQGTIVNTRQPMATMPNFKPPPPPMKPKPLVKKKDPNTELAATIHAAAAAKAQRNPVIHHHGGSLRSASQPLLRESMEMPPPPSPKELAHL